MLNFMTRRARVCTVAAGVLLLAGATLLLWRVPRSRPPTLLSTNIEDWRAYEGAWSSRDGIITDGKGGRGDKLIASDPTLNDLVFSTNLRFNTSRDFEFGDAGLVLRASNFTIGTDSMYGYYAGIRPGTQSMKLGRMEDDYTDLAVSQLSEPVRIGAWYRLAVEVHACHFQISVFNDQNRAIGSLDDTDTGCVMRSGRVGLRNYSMVVSWRDLALQPLT